MCGENTPYTMNVDENTGSPPHVRGKPIFSTSLLDLVRITPACAGKTD